MQVEFEGYDSNHSTNLDLDLGQLKIENVYFSYDGGRLSVMVNGETVLETAFAGNSFSVSIDK